MKRSIMAAAFIPLLLPACADVDTYLLHNAFASMKARGENERQYLAEVQACGSGPGATWCRLAADNSNLSRLYPVMTQGPPPPGAYVFDQSQCVGTYEHGMCMGVRQPRTTSTPTCHGQEIDGVCAGPVF